MCQALFVGPANIVVDKTKQKPSLMELVETDRK